MSRPAENILLELQRVREEPTSQKTNDVPGGQYQPLHRAITFRFFEPRRNSPAHF